MAKSFGAGKYARGAEGSAVVLKGFAELQASLKAMADGSFGQLRARILEIGARVALVAASMAPRRTGALQHSIRVAAFSRGASVYSNVVYGGAINFGAWSRGRGPHISRASASHYMDRAVDQSAPWVEQEVNAVLEWAMATFMEAG